VLCTYYFLEADPGIVKELTEFELPSTSTPKLAALSLGNPSQILPNSVSCVGSFREIRLDNLVGRKLSSILLGYQAPGTNVTLRGRLIVKARA